MRMRITALAAAVLALAGCGGTPTTTASNTASGPEVTRRISLEDVSKNKDPKQGWVLVANDVIGYYGYETLVVKKCDGTTLLYVQYGYQKGGPAVIANSPECGP